MDNDREDFIDHAIEYASHGWKPYPIQPPNGKGCTCRKGEECSDPGKHPYHDLGGMNSATKDKQKLKTIFGNSDANIGLRCDKQFWALDAEREGIDDLDRMIEENGSLPITPTARTGGEGRHYLFSFDKRVKMGLTKIGGLSIDTPHQIVAAPSRHATGGEYQWIRRPEDFPLAKAPEWLIDFVTGKSASQSQFEFEDDSDLEDHPGVGEGDRNATLCRLVGRRLAEHGDTPDLLRLAVEWGNRCDPPYPEKKTFKVVANLVAKHLTNNPPEEEEESSELTIRPFSDIEAKPIAWLWTGRFALGKITLLTGDGGVGKSMLTCDMAARITRGVAFSDGSPGVTGEVFFIGAEDGAEDTIRPRLDAAGADPNHVFLIGGPIPEGEKYASPIDLSRHVAKLDQLLDRYPESRLLVIDPIMDFLGAATDSNKATDVRRVLSPLRELAEKHNVAIVAMNHLNKSGQGSKNRSLGSGAFVHVARVELRVCEDPEDADRRLLLPVKNNLSAAPGLAYRIVPWEDNPEVGKVAWEEGTVDIQISDVESDSGTRTKIDEAEEWLRVFLSDGRVEAKAGLKEASAHRIADKTLRRAMKRVGVHSFQEDRKWWWELPIVDEADGEPSSESDNSFRF